MDQVQRSCPHQIGDASRIDTHEKNTCNVPARALNIIWGNDPRFWQLQDLPQGDTTEFEFKECAVLLQVNWIEVTAKIQLETLKGHIHFNTHATYEVMWHIKFRPDSFGWNYAPIKFKVRIHGAESEKIVPLGPYTEKPNLWHHISGGQFSLARGPALLEFGMFEVDSDMWKGGLVIAGVTIRPKNATT